MRRIAVICLILALGGCGLEQQAQLKEAQEKYAAGMREAKAKTEAAFKECRDKRLAGELKTYVESVQCSNPQMLAAFREARYPYMDLVALMAAARLAGYERVDKGQLTEAQFQLQYAELVTRVSAEEQRRSLAALNARSQAIAASAAQSQASAANLQAAGVMLQGLSAFQAVNNPMPVTCTTFGTMATCR